MSDAGFRRVAILGLGAMGGSLAKALAALDTPPEVLGWSPVPDERTKALEVGAVTHAPSLWQDAARDADLIVLAAPLGACCELMGLVGDVAPPDAILTDVASLKRPVQEAARAAGLLERWVGAHPMAGSEESGFAASRADLYRSVRVWTVSNGAPQGTRTAVRDFWRSVGSDPVDVDPDDHDRLMAHVSHLPQLTSNALAVVLAEAGVLPDQLGPGGHDMTRLAASGAGVWRDLLVHAAPELSAGLRALAESASAIADKLDARELDALEALMRSTRSWSRPE